MFKDYLTALLAITILAACTTPSQHRRAQFTRVLDRAQEQNLAYDSITNVDSIRMAVDYFNRHGSANEQMRAWYLMGCAYRDMGDAPRAVESYHKSIASADTISKDCDYRQLYKVYGQLAELMYMQNMPNHVINAYRKVYDYAMLVGDTIPAYLALYHQADAYDLTGDTDSVSSICKNAYKLFEGIGRKDLAASTLFMLVFAELGKDDFESAGKHIAEYEECSGIKEHKENYWNDGMLLYAKGLCALGNKNPALAERCFREELLVSDDVDNKHAGFDGLRKVFQAIHQPDSTAKYAVLSMEFNDSVFHEMNTKHLQQMEAAYNYSSAQKKTIIIEKENSKMKTALASAIALLIFALMLSLIMYLIYKKKREMSQRMEFEWREKYDDLLQARNEIAALSNADKEGIQDVILNKKEQLEQLESQVSALQRQKHLMVVSYTEEKLTDASIVRLFKKSIADRNITVGADQWHQLRNHVAMCLPTFVKTIENHRPSITETEMRVCILVRLHFPLKDIALLENITLPHLGIMRKRLLKKMFGIDGSAKEFDKIILQIT